MKRIERSASITLDTGTTRACLDHNVRKTIAEHVDTARSYMNKILVNIDVREAYERLFKEAVDKYLSRNKKKAPLDLLEYMSMNKRKPFREIIVQIGNMLDTPADSEIGRKAAEILLAFFAEFIKRNPYLYVICAVLHMDEATPHLHITFIPWGEGYTKWLERRVSFARALKMQGFEHGTRAYSTYRMWMDNEKQRLGEAMERYGMEWVSLGTHNKHKNIHSFKLEMARTELEELEQKTSDLREEIAIARKGAEGIRAAEKYSGELLGKLDYDPQYQLSEPPAFMSAKKYMSAVVNPLYDRLKALAKELADRLPRAKAVIAEALTEKAELEHKVRDLMLENNTLKRQLDNEKQRSLDLSLVKDALGHDNVNMMLDSIKAKKKGTRVKKSDYYDIGL